ncbi:SDR family NAD(P)-dependent oxidoreductase [Streptomyces sp. NPDC002133]|uniref:SDR family oxidoreductase n=1 Tax=Streptomyces sp. NPDC002133 TaxID=3154409 RepID=UPI0033192745
MTKPLIVVTGASHGIGRAVTEAFAAEEHPLLLVSRHPAALEGLPPEQLVRAAVDVADYAALEAAVRAAEDLYGPTECLVNCAGFLRIGGLETRDPADMSYEVDVLLKGVLNGIRAVLGGMRARNSGTIINVSSVGDRAPGPDGEVYHACKAALRSLAGSLQKSQAKSNIRVVNVAPGFVRTNIHAEMGISFEEYVERLGHPDFISAEELADIVLFCWKQPQHICVRDIVVMPTSSDFG